MKRITAFLLIFAMLFAVLSGCSANENKNSKLSVVTTVFPEYDWVRNIIGEDNDNIELSMLIDSGVDLHSFQPTADDIIKISTCDVFIYIGGESDSWVDDVLKEKVNKDMKIVNLLETLGAMAKEEEEIEGMQAEADEVEGAFDEHIWLSLRNAKYLVQKLRDVFVSLDSENAEKYGNNSDAYLQKLSELDDKFVSETDTDGEITLLFGDRFPFRYFCDDYGIKYYAAFSGCSAESEASFETVRFLSEKIDELKLKSVIVLEGSHSDIAETVINNSRDKNAKIVTFDSMQNKTKEDVASGESYLSVMEKNLSALKEALA